MKNYGKGEARTSKKMADHPKTDSNMSGYNSQGRLNSSSSFSNGVAMSKGPATNCGPAKKIGNPG